VTHGSLARELTAAARRIIDGLEDVVPISIGWEQDVDEARERIKAGLEKVTGTAGALILTDMFGGTPTNLALTFLEEGHIEVVTGVNLPMLLKLTTLADDRPLRDVAADLKEQAQKSIHVASEVLASET